MTNGHDDIDDASFEDFGDDYEPDLDADLDMDVDADLDLDDLDDDSFESEASGGGGGGGKGRDQYSDKMSSVAGAVRANPKRQQARKKARRIISGLLIDADLDTDEGLLQAWHALRDQTDASIAKPYSISAALQENDTVTHPSFGLGFVIAELTTTKVEVLFEVGLKKLVCNK